MLLVGWLAGCGAAAGSTITPSQARSSSVGAAAPENEPGSVPSARVGKPGRTERVHFVPELLVLPGNAEAPVQPAATVDGQLQVPENVQHVGWWDGSADAGDPFGSTVIAGHLDSATSKNGFFARLKRVKKDDVVTLRAGPHRLSYKISSVHKVPRRALATDTKAFDQSGAHRLVLITCDGVYRRDRGGYESNLVVVGIPLGKAR